MMLTNRFAHYLLAFLGSAIFVSCAVNPATGRRQLVLIGEGREIEMGREADQQLTASLGLYGNDSLQSYIQELGASMAKLSERPSLPWSFRLVDDPVVNAFALPGGFIFITRGIMAHLNSEAQLASVVGHEIGHVTGKHSVEQMSRAQFAQVGLGIGSIASETFANFAGVASSGLGLLFLKYGRDDESEADRLGLRYIRRRDYDPRPMAEVFALLGLVSASSGGDGPPQWLSTHPDPANRKEAIEELIAGLGETFENDTVGRVSYLRRVDGMVFGSNPRDGYFEQSLFLHPNLEFQFRFPAGWTTQNGTSAVVAVNESQNTIIQLATSDAAIAGEAARTFLSQQGINGSTVQSIVVGGLTAATGRFTIRSEETNLQGEVMYVEHDTNVFEIIGYGTTAAWRSNGDVVSNSLRTFSVLTDPEALSIQPMRISVETIDEAITLREFDRRFPSEVAIGRIALLNQADIETEFPSGTLLKRVVR